MGLFSRSPKPRPQLQPPDQFAQEAADHYRSQRFYLAFSTYAQAVDKIHTMCVVAPRESRIRSLSTDDAAILDGLTASLGAALATDQREVDRSEVHSTLGYLRDIATEAHGSEVGEIYGRAVEQIEIELRLNQD